MRNTNSARSTTFREKRNQAESDTEYNLIIQRGLVCCVVMTVAGIANSADLRQ